MLSANQILVPSCLALTLTAVAQGAYIYQTSNSVIAHASWQDNPKSIEAATKKSKNIVLARVEKIERSKDICVAAKGEPEGKDCIPNEVVTLVVEGKFKGDVQKRIPLFHTGISPLSLGEEKVPPRPKDNMHGGKKIEDRKVHKPSARERISYSLHDDPPYRKGEQYIMFLTDGPVVTNREGKKLKTSRAVNPSFRIKVKNEKVYPASTHNAFSKQVAGRGLKAVTAKLPKMRPVK